MGCQITEQKNVEVCLRRPQWSKLRRRSNKHLVHYTHDTMDNKRKRISTLAVGIPLQTKIPIFSHYYCLEGPASIEAAGKRIRKRVLLDSESNIFVINKELVEYFNTPYETRQKGLNILAFDGEVNTSGGNHFTHPILLEIGKNETAPTSLVRLRQQGNRTLSFHLDGGIRNILYQTLIAPKNGILGHNAV